MTLPTSRMRAVGGICSEGGRGTVHTSSPSARKAVVPLGAAVTLTTKYRTLTTSEIEGHSNPADQASVTPLSSSELVLLQMEPGGGCASIQLRTSWGWPGTSH